MILDLPYSSIFLEPGAICLAQSKSRKMPENAVNQELLALFLLPMTGLSTNRRKREANPERRLTSTIKYFFFI
jgi:hypothetical protein